MGIVKYPNIEMYWEPELKHAPFKYMSLVRYQQIKRFYHLSPPDIAIDKQHWSRKLEPIASLLHQRFQQYYFPSTSLSYDEIMVSFEGRSMHIVKQPNKPIDHGYKIWGLCDYGFTWTFLFYSGAVVNEVSEFCVPSKQYADLDRERECRSLRLKRVTGKQDVWNNFNFLQHIMKLALFFLYFLLKISTLIFTWVTYLLLFHFSITYACMA